MHTLIMLSLLLLSFYSLSLQACTLKMGYRTTARLPNIAAVPSNKGVYQDLYQTAATRLGCQLEIIRLPKKRILRDLIKGDLDFYPGLTFSEERAVSIFFAANGLPSADVGLSRVELPEVKTYYDLKGKQVLRALGSPSIDADEYGVTIKTPPELTFKKAINYILDKQADFYKDEIGTLAYYLKDHPRAKELKFHLNCCGGLTDLTIGFSRNSAHYAEEVNPDYNEKLPLSYQNYPQRLQKSSLAFRFTQVLMQLKAEGYTDGLYQSYYGVSLKELLKGD